MKTVPGQLWQPYFDKGKATHVSDAPGPKVSVTRPSKPPEPIEMIGEGEEPPAGVVEEEGDCHLPTPVQQLSRLPLIFVHLAFCGETAKLDLNGMRGSEWYQRPTG